MGVARAAHGFDATTSAGYSRDNLGLFYTRTEIGLAAPETDYGTPTYALQLTYAGGSDVRGIPGGYRTTAGGRFGFRVDTGELRWSASGGVDDATRLDSAAAEAEGTFAPGSWKGFSLRARAQSGWLDSWLTYRVRSTQARAGAMFSSESDWAELAALVDFRSGGLRRRTAVPLALPDNRLFTAYSYWAHAWVSFLVAGAAVRFSDSREDLHQASHTEDGEFRYVDFPYPTPHGEWAVNGLVEVILGSLKLKASWPAFSVGSYRVESPYERVAVYLYQTYGRGPAEVKGSLEVPLGKECVLTLEAHANSSPYAPYAWFRGRAWNEFGISTQLAYAEERDKR